MKDRLDDLAVLTQSLENEIIYMRAFRESFERNLEYVETQASDSEDAISNLEEKLTEVIQENIKVVKVCVQMQQEIRDLKQRIVFLEEDPKRENRL